MEFRIENMTCGGCARSVTKAIKAVDPAAEVKADPPSRKLEVTSAAPAQSLVAAMEKAGFSAVVAQD